MKRMVFCLTLVMSKLVCAYAVCEAEKTEATQFHFELAQDESLYIENQIFTEPVTVSGDFGQIIFANCEFHADLINVADFYTRVMLMPDTVVHGSLVLKNNVKEGTMETPIPKFITFVDAPVVCEDCIGSVVVLGDFEIKWNDETYALQDSTLFFDCTKPENGMVPYEGQEANCYVVAQWWENGEKTMLIECEYDSEM